MMGRQDRDQGQLFYEFKLDDVIPKNHRLRRMNVFVTTALGRSGRFVISATTVWNARRVLRVRHANAGSSIAHSGLTGLGAIRTIRDAV